MIVPVFKSLSKPMTWGGVPRNIFILIILASLISVVIFQSIKGVLPILAVYMIVLALCKYDPKIFTILYKAKKLYKIEEGKKDLNKDKELCS